jgi:release factor glutamine methyltransferase
MTYKKIVQQLQQDVKNIYEKQEAENIAWLLLMHYTQKNKLDLILNHQEPAAHILQNIHHATDLLLQNKPVQYIIGEQYFQGLSFIVNEHVLIPRPETEELVEFVLQQNNKSANLKILDIGTGSGCIPISIKYKKENWEVSACDISKDALQVAKQNAEKHKTKIDFFEHDILTCDSHFKQQYNIIISNPPYILLPEKQDMRNNVLLHEPHLALFVSNQDALQFYKAVLNFAEYCLMPKGKIYFECNEMYAVQVAMLCAGYGYENTVLQDMQGKDRFVIALKD